MPFRVAILTVSDTAYSKGPEYDLSGPLLRQRVEQNPDYALADTAIVPDDIVAIQTQVREWVERKGSGKVDWIISTGGKSWSCTKRSPSHASSHASGTGFGERDVTPQVSRFLCTTMFPGPTEYISTSL